MKYLLQLTVVAGLFLPPAADAQYLINRDSVYGHIAVLASDSLEGREVGEDGEAKAARYISSIFSAAGLRPAGDHGSYLQSFDFIKRIDLGDSNHLTLNDVELTPGSEFSPLHHSANASFSFDDIVDVGYGIVAAHGGPDDYEGKEVAGKAVLLRRYSPEPADTSDTAQAAANDRYADLTDKIITAVERKVAGIFVITPASHDDTLIGMGATRVTAKDVPIVFLRRAALERLGLSIENPVLTSAVGQTDLRRIRDTGYNVVGLLPGQTDSVIVIGAHYDHLGWGTESSRYLGKEKKIHYGADDNGSGTAALMELARSFAASSESPRHSVLFLAFSGEEAGLLGSSHYVRNWTVPRDRVRMMLNMDMIGRLNEQEKGLVVLGTGTCEQFKTYFDSLQPPTVKMTFSESGSGPSDHAAFYNDSIPVLHFFTGAHPDYHTPDDVVDKIDTDGVVAVANMVASIVRHFDRSSEELVFLRTKDEQQGRHRSQFSVTLGIMPDYVAEVEGLRIDGVSPGRPADNAGMLRGDVIIGLGDQKIGDIYDYMSALGRLRLGDSAEARLVRGSDTLTVTVEFVKPKE